MIDFIIYEKDIEKRELYEFIILNFIGVREETFKIFDYNTYTNNDNTRKIYIISTENIKEAINMANNIRNNNDWDSQIVIISDIENTFAEDFINNLLILDYINNGNNISNRLKKDLYIAYKILANHKSLVFSINNEIHKIPYKDIFYVEKLNNLNYCTIYTIDKKHIVKDTIKGLEKKLDSAYFLKTHRSCIVNLHNIEYYDCFTNVIHFTNNIQVDLVSRDKRKILKSKLIEEKIEK